MKNLTIIFFILMSCRVFAQDTLIVSESKSDMSLGNQNGFTILIPKAKQKDVVSDWKKYLREKNKSSYNEINNEYVLSKSLITDISKDSVIIYTKFANLPLGVSMTSFISSKDSVFFSSSSDAETGKKFSDFLRTFAVNEYKKAVEDELKSEQKKLKNLESDLSDIEGDNDRMEKKIKSNERENEKMKDEIKTNLSAIEIKTTSIVQQQQILATFTDASERKSEEEKRLKNIEKEKRKLQKDNENLNSKIDNNESDNKSLQKKIDFNISDSIPAKKAEIAKQQNVVKSVEENLKNIH